MAKKQPKPTDTRLLADYATREQAAAMHGVAKSTLNSWIASGEIAVEPWHGSSVVVSLDAVAARVAVGSRQGKRNA